MKNLLKSTTIAIVLLFNLTSCISQESSNFYPKLIGGPCDGCEAVLDYGNQKLSATDTLPEFEETEPKIKVTGTIYEEDGKTPAEGVIMFVHQTNRKGVYPKRGDEKGWAREYGYIHGWVKTGTDGKYTIYTFKPGHYGGPAHIHPVILEPNGQYYWLGSFLFENDPRLTEEDKNPKSPRGGGNGILFLTMEDGILVGRRDIILGNNISGHE